MPLKTKGLKPGKGKQTFQVLIPGVGWRTISAFVKEDGSFYILPPKRPPAITPDAPVVTSNLPNPRILNKVAPIARNLVMKAARPGDPEPYCFGIQSARPLIIGADDDGEHLVLDMLWSVGEIEAVTGPQQDIGNPDVARIFMPDVGYVDVSGSTHEHFVGTSGQSASTIMTALKGSYDALPNKAHSVITMELGWNLNILVFIKGVKVFDPRPSPQVTAWTENPALILADILTRCGYTMNWDSVGDAADWAEGLLTSPQLERSKIGGQITTRQQLNYWVQALAQYAGCFVDVRGGEVVMVADKPGSSTHTVTTSSIVAGSERLRLRGSINAPSQVAVTFSAPAGSDYTSYYGTSAGPGTETALRMPFFDDQYVAGLKAKEVYIKSQNPIESLEVLTWDDGLERTLGDIGTVTLPSVNLSGQLMTLVENVPIQRGRWRRKYIEYDADNYPMDLTGVSYGQPSYTLHNPYMPPDGPTPTLTIEAAPESPEWTRIRIDFPNELWAYLKDFYVTVTTTTDLETILYEEYIDPLSSATSPQINTTYTDFVAQLGTSPQTVYRVNVYVRSIVDALSETPGTADTVELDLTVGLQAWWPFDEASGTRYNAHQTESPALYRFEPRAYNYPSSPWTIDGGSVGSTTGVLTTSSPLALAAQIDTSSPADWLSTYFDSADGIATATSFTVAGWVKMDTVDVVQGIMRKGNINTTGGTNLGEDWLLYYAKAGITSPQVWSLTFTTRTTGTDKTVTAAAPLVAGQWHYICCWFEDTVGAGMSLDGVTIGTSLITQSPAPPLEQRFNAIHAGLYQISGFGPQYPLNGALDEWGFWNRALSEEEITWLYNSGAGRAYTDL